MRGPLETNSKRYAALAEVAAMTRGAAIKSPGTEGGCGRVLTESKSKQMDVRQISRPVARSSARPNARRAVQRAH